MIVRQNQIFFYSCLYAFISNCIKGLRKVFFIFYYSYAVADVAAASRASFSVLESSL